MESGSAPGGGVESGSTGEQGLRPPEVFYQMTMLLISQRLVALAFRDAAEPARPRMERIAFQVRKIVEGVAFAALSAAEHANPRLPRSLREKDAAQLLSWLLAKGLLRLPEAMDPRDSEEEGIRAVFQGRWASNLDVPRLKAMYSRASRIVHERHPERLSDQIISTELAATEQDAAALREWLWSHITYIGPSAFAVLMERAGTSDFWLRLDATDASG